MSQSSGSGKQGCDPKSILTSMNERRRYSRKELEELKGKSRREIFEILGSFDERSLDDAAFIGQTIELVDAARIPGLGHSNDPDHLAASIMAACHRDSETTQDRPDISPDD
ncbi:MAG: hypothetical protein HOB49_03800, partial [Gemmatimonadetes bacterium]|nr:hypothetical protein [Gemmatimonadota bacterium]